MALPAGVTTATVTVGVPVTFSGGALKSTITITPSVLLVHTATGHPLVNMVEETSTTEGVAAQFTLPHTDQAGFQDEAGNAYQNWYYTATIQYQQGKVTKPPFTKVFQLAVGQTTVDLDLLPSGSPAMPYTAPVATVTSFAGRTGAVTVQDSDLPARLSDASLNATYAPLLDSIVQNLPKVADVYALAPTPTITLSAASAATSIAGGVDRVPKRKTVGAAVASPADLEDPNFRYIGAYVDSLNYGGSFPDWDYLGRNYLTGGAGQAAMVRPTYSMVYTGRYLEIKFKALTTRSVYMLKIDGYRVTEDAAALTTVAGSIYRLIIDFGTAAIRKIEFLSDNTNFGGATIEPAANLYRGPKPRRIGMAFGDSISAGAGDGAGGASYLDTSAHRVLDALGCDAYVNTAIGGTRYTGAGGDMSTFINRLPDITAIAPDVLIVWGSYNDAAVATGAEIETAATTFLNAVKAALPRTLVIVLGCYTPGNPTNAALWAANTAVKNAAAATGYPFVDVLDPLELKATTPVWAASTAYRNGDIVQNSNALYACIQGHTSTGTFDQTKFRGMSWINGTGKVGTTTGLGNSDTFILSDGVHPTLEGHTYLERRELESIVGKLRQIAGH